IPKWTNC
ncbi:unnamed protein product, partial [Allacma fusca]